MRRLLSVPVLVLMFTAGALAQQQQSSDPYKSPPPPPQAPSTQPDKGCSGQAVKGDKGSWKTSSTCPPAAKSDAKPAVQTAPDAGQKPKSTEEDNPFPEDISRQAEAESKARDAAASKAASTAAGESSSRNPQLENLDLEGDRDSRISDGAGGIVHDPKLAADDVHVGQFYLNREDYKGAYTRFKEATQADPENADAVFFLAEAARRMNHKDEAVQNYQLYLAAVPDGPKAKDAQKALKALSTSAKH